MGWQASERRMVLTEDLKSRMQQVDVLPRDFGGLLLTDEFYSFDQLKVDLLGCCQCFKIYAFQAAALATSLSALMRFRIVQAFVLLLQ